MEKNAITRHKILRNGGLQKSTHIPTRHLVIDALTHEKLKKYCKRKGLSMKNMAEVAIELFLSQDKNIINVNAERVTRW